MDIVERLRMYGRHDERSAFHINDLAADEIEHLRAQIAAKDAALRRIEALTYSEGVEGDALDMATEIAREALTASARESE